MNKIIILIGLPGSGKSTWAKEQLKKNPDKYIRVNKDELRLMLHNGKFSRANEEFVLEIRDYMIVSALAEGKSVIVDDTNLHPKHKQRMEEIIKENNFDANVEEKFFDVPVEECIKRDLARVNSVGEKVIKEMYDKYLRKTEKYQPDETKPFAIICDVDGTIAEMNGRSPYSWNKVETDLPKEEIIDIVNKYHQNGVKIIIVSGRDGKCLDTTKKWLSDNDVNYDDIFIRTEGNNEKDEVVKERIFNEHIRDNYNVLFVLDDRDSVVNMWRRKGLTCLQVDYGNF